MDDSEPNLTHRSNSESLISKSCDRPFKTALNHLSMCQCAAHVSHTHAAIKLLTLSRFYKVLLFEFCVDVVVRPASHGVVVRSAVVRCGCSTNPPTFSNWARPRIVLSALPSRNYTPLPCNSHQIAKTCFTAHYQPLIQDSFIVLLVTLQDFQ